MNLFCYTFSDVHITHNTPKGCHHQIFNLAIFNWGFCQVSLFHGAADGDMQKGIGKKVTNNETKVTKK